MHVRLFNRKTEFEPHFYNFTSQLIVDGACCVMDTLTVEMEIGVHLIMRHCFRQLQAWCVLKRSERRGG